MNRPCSVPGCDRFAREHRTMCKRCAQAHARLAARDGESLSRIMLPSEPLVALVEARGGIGGGAVDQGIRRAYVRAKTNGKVSVASADRLSLRVLGCHPCEVWGEWFGPYGVNV